MPAPSPHSVEKFCRHLRGYWISKERGSFRCYDCGFQVSEADLPPSDQRNIEIWEPSLCLPSPNKSST